MKRIKIVGSATLLLACSVVTSQANLSLSFASASSGATSGDINFLGNSMFNFGADSDGADFVIGTGSSASGDLGTISGTYTIGTVGSIGNVQTASVSGNGTVSINDGHNGILTGNVSWIDLTTIGTSGTLNVNGVLNLTGITYTGSTSPQADLTALALGGLASDTLDFTFNPAKNITALKAYNGGTTYSGTISASAVPEPTTLISGALLLLPFGASTLRILRKNRAA